MSNSKFAIYIIGIVLYCIWLFLSFIVYSAAAYSEDNSRQIQRAFPVSKSWKRFHETESFTLLNSFYPSKYMYIQYIYGMIIYYYKYYNKHTHYSQTVMTCFARNLQLLLNIFRLIWSYGHDMNSLKRKQIFKKNT